MFFHGFIFFSRASPAYNPYYYGYAPYPAYPQAHPYAYAQNEEPQTTGAQPEGWGQYLSSSFWNYVPNFPYITGSQSASEGQSESGATSSAESSECTEIIYKNIKTRKLYVL